MDKLDRKDIQDIFALTPLQNGMLFHYLQDPGEDPYFGQLSLEISGEIDAELFEKAWNVVIKTNEMLRAVFRWEKVENPVQIILKEYKLPLQYHDLSRRDAVEKESLLEEVRIKDRKEKFDLREVPFRVMLCKMGENKYTVIISNHHILYDGWSNGVILKEFFQAYDKLCKGKPLILPVKRKFKEFILWIQNRDMKKQEKFWRDYLEGVDTATEISIKRTKGVKAKNPRADTYHLGFTGDDRNRFEDFVKRHKTTLGALFYNTWGLLLQKYNNSDDVIFGTTVSGRSAKIKAIEDMVGLFINTVPLRVKTYADDTLSEVLYRTNQALLQRAEYESTALVNIKEWSELESSEELFDSIVVIENYPLDALLQEQKSRFSIDSYAMVEMTNYDLTVVISISAGIDINFIYNAEVLEEEHIVQLGDHLRVIVEDIIKHPGKECRGVELLSEGEKNRLIYEFNDTGGDYPKDKTIHALFAEQARKTPDAVAGVGTWRGKTVFLTYSQLSEESDGVACSIWKKGVREGEPVGILVGSTIERIIGILGILKAGCGYVPLNPGAPASRIKYILEDCNIKLLITAGGVFAEGKTAMGWEDEVYFLDERSIPAAAPGKDFRRRLQRSYTLAANLAYVIFTSGSTGKPKGVPIRHANVSALFNWGYKFMDIGPMDRVAQNLSYSFDWSVWEIFIGLILGASLYMVPEDVLMDPLCYIDFLNRNRITVIHITNPHLLSLVHQERKLETLRYLCIGGEKLTFDLVRRSYEVVTEDCQVFNVTGPTETSIISNMLHIDGKSFDFYLNKGLASLPVGKTVGNTVLVVLDRNMKLCPVFVPGEMYVLGYALADGYLNKPELTAEKFITPSPLVLDGLPAIIYKSGDSTRWLPDGNLEVLGRIDHQVKIRGYRIEIGEIENRLTNHDSVKEAVVMVRGDESGGKDLCAYVVPCSSHSLNFNELREHLSQTLPEYMIPTYFVKLEKMPLTSSGKTDRKALSKVEIVTETDSYTAPRNDVERKLVELWSRILQVGKEKIGIDAHFFKIGGHSLKATALASSMHKEFNKRVSPREIFEMPTVRKLSQYIRGADEERYTSIDVTEEKEYYALSSAQMRLYFLQQMDEAAIAYNIPTAWELAGALDSDTLVQTFRKLIQRHESLRTSFHVVGEVPVQRIHETGEVEFELQSGSLPGDFLRPFDLSRAPLLRVGVTRIAEAKYLLMVDLHHIIADGMSVEILVQEFMDLCADKELPRIKFRYKDYLVWQQGDKEKGRIKKQGDYWEKQFEREIPVLDLPFDFSRPAVQGFEGSSLNFELTGETTGLLNALAIDSGATVFMVLLGLYTIFLAKVSGQEDIVIGTPVAGRKHIDLESIVGLFINTLPLGCYIAGSRTFIRFLAELKEKTLQAFENQEYHYEDLVEHVVHDRDISRNPLFDVFFIMQPQMISRLEIPGLKLTTYEQETITSKFDLTLLAAEDKGEGKLRFQFEYSTKLFIRRTIERFITYFKNIVSGVLENKDRRIWELEIISPDEKKQVLTDFNNTRVDYPKDKTIHALFAEQAERAPDGAAVVCREQIVGARGTVPLPLNYISITYKELNEKSNRLAHMLRQKGIQPDSIIGIMVERSVEMMIGILGILKAGCAYLPIDPGYPRERIDFMLKDSHVKVLLSEVSKVSKVSGGTEVMDLPSLVVETEDAEPTHLTHPTQLCYVIYTSGSTGRPKGVMITHGNVVNFITGITSEIEFLAGKAILALTTISFDIFVLETLLPLIRGLKVIIGTEIEQKDPELLSAVIAAHGVNMLQMTPSGIKLLVDRINNDNQNCLGNLGEIMIGGERLPENLFERLKALYQGKIYNLYGPTETTVWSTLKNLTGREKITIGTPTANTGIFILDRYKRLQPPGIVGELFIGGDGVAPGYANRQELTLEKFIPNPFEKSGNLYETGDLARWLADGDIEFLGRVDHQVKVRGFRIEPEEIVNHLLTHGEIKETVVVTGEDDRGDKYLAAYIVSRNETNAGELREYLLRRLPEYMVPSYFIRLAEIPLTPNGKINRKALPVPEPEAGEGYRAPRDEIEEKLVEIWSDVLARDASRPSIGIDDNFFLLGGHSLKGIALVSKIHKAFNIKLPLVEIFKRATIRATADYIREAVEDRYELYVTIDPAEEKEYYVLSSAQKRLYVLQQMDYRATGYNIPSVVELAGPLHKEKFENALAALIKRHESLRTSFVIIDDEPVQTIHEHEDLEFAIEYHPTGSPSEVEKMIEDFVRPFDLKKAPLVRAGLITLKKKTHILMVDMHHIIADGVSLEVFVTDFPALYAGKELPALKLHYKDFSQWQTNAKERNSLIKQEAYWLEQFEKEIPLLDLPTDYERPAVQSFAGATTGFEIGPEEAGALKMLALEEGTTLFMVVFTLYYIFLAKICNQEDIVIGTPAAGRRHDELAQVIGMFVNMLALRNYPGEEKRFTTFLREVRERTLEAFENQEYKFEDLVDKLELKRDGSRSPLFDAVFALDIIDEHSVVKPGKKKQEPEADMIELHQSEYAYKDPTSKFDLILKGREESDRLFLSFEYRTKLFNEETIKIFIEYFKEIISYVLTNKEIKLSDIKVSHELLEPDANIVQQAHGDFGF